MGWLDKLKDLGNLGLVDLVSNVFETTADLVDDLHTSEEERLVAKASLLRAEAQALELALSYEKEALLARAKIVEAEASSEHTVTAIWRPVVMLVFTGLAVGDALSLLPNPLASEAWVLLQIGLGGYVVGRSAEKVVKTIKRD